MKKRDLKPEARPKRDIEPETAERRSLPRRQEEPSGLMFDVFTARLHLMVIWFLDWNEADSLLAAGISDGSIRLFNHINDDQDEPSLYFSSTDFVQMIFVTKGPVTIADDAISADGRVYTTIRVCRDDLDTYTDDNAYKHRKKAKSPLGAPPKYDWDTFEQEISSIANSASCPKSFTKLHQATVDQLTSKPGFKKSKPEWPPLSAARKHFGTRFKEQIKAARR